MEFRTDLGNGLRRHSPGEDAAQNSELSPSELSEKCLKLAYDLGFIRAGVAALEPFGQQAIGLSEFLARGYHASMGYLAAEEDGELTRRNPRLFAQAKAAIVVALPYSAASLRPRKPSVTKHSPGKIAAYARGYDYHIIMKDKLLRLADAIADLTGKELLARACVDSAPLFERDLAQRAGVVFVGKNTLGISPGAGSHFLLGELLVDLQLEKNTQLQAEGCGSCRACLDACPTDAFVQEGLLDARRCISYLTIESREDIPEELRTMMGERIFGCDECQSVCPYNQSSAARKSAPELDAKEHLEDPDLLTILQHGSNAHRRFVQGTALRRVTRDQLARNAAIALANRGSDDAAAPLAHAALEHRSEQVREHALWALRKLAQSEDAPEARIQLHEVEQSLANSDE